MDNGGPFEGLVLVWHAFLMTPPIFKIAFVGMMAALMGSFINVCIWRIPRGQSIVWPRSRCTSCGHVLDGVDLLPIVTYLATRGHCRHCRAPVSSRYVIVEIINVSLWMFAYACCGFTPYLAILGVILSTTLATVGIMRMKDEIKREAARTAAGPPEASRGGRISRRGFTFISVMLACFLLAVSIGPFMDVTRIGYLGATKNAEYIKGYALAQEKLEELHTLPFHKIVSDRKIYIETERVSDNIFGDEFFGDFSKMREDPKYFNAKFSDVYTALNELPPTTMERFKRAYKNHYGTDYQVYPQGYEMFRRTLVVEDMKDKDDPKIEMKKAIVTVEINSKATKGRQLVLEAVFTDQ